MRKPRTVLDEREMQEMYRIDHLGLNLVIVLLVAAIVLQLLLGSGMQQVTGESVVLVITVFTLIVLYAKHGIWDADARPDWRDNAKYALLCGAGVGLLAGAMTGSVLKTVLLGAGAVLVAMGLLSLLMMIVEKEQRKLEEELEEDV